VLPKVFKIKEVELSAKKEVYIYKKHSFKNFTTRKHYPGVHKISIKVNGEILAEKSFKLNR
jgi:hypothetical protein